MTVLDLDHARRDFDEERRCEATYGDEYCGNAATVWDRVLDRYLCDEHREMAGIPETLEDLAPGEIVEIFGR